MSIVSTSDRLIVHKYNPNKDAQGRFTFGVSGRTAGRLPSAAVVAGDSDVSSTVMRRVKVALNKLPEGHTQGLGSSKEKFEETFGMHRVELKSGKGPITPEAGSGKMSESPASSDRMNDSITLYRANDAKYPRTMENLHHEMGHRVYGNIPRSSHAPHAREAVRLSKQFEATTVAAARVGRPYLRDLANAPVGKWVVRNHETFAEMYSSYHGHGQTPYKQFPATSRRTFKALHDHLATPQPVEKSANSAAILALAPHGVTVVKASPAAEQETEQIKVRAQTAEAQNPHKFQAAHWTHPNGHPRCRICGCEESLDGKCPGLKAEPVRFGPGAAGSKLAMVLLSHGPTVMKFNPWHDPKGKFADSPFPKLSGAQDKAIGDKVRAFDKDYTNYDTWKEAYDAYCDARGISSDIRGLAEAQIGDWQGTGRGDFAGDSAAKWLENGVAGKLTGRDQQAFGVAVEWNGFVMKTLGMKSVDVSRGVSHEQTVRGLTQAAKVNGPVAIESRAFSSWTTNSELAIGFASDAGRGAVITARFPASKVIASSRAFPHHLAGEGEVIVASTSRAGKYALRIPSGQKGIDVRNWSEYAG